MRRIGKVLMVVAGAAALVLGIPGQAAWSSQNITVRTTDYGAGTPGDDDIRGGHAVFQADPVGGVPGDSVFVCDADADGYGVRAELYRLRSDNSWAFVRAVEWRGGSDHCTDPVGGNLAEETIVYLRVCLVAGDWKGNCSDFSEGRA